jgi:hypothetical protein
MKENKKSKKPFEVTRITSNNVIIYLVNRFKYISLEGKPIPTELRAEATKLQKELNFDEAQPGT